MRLAEKSRIDQAEHSRENFIFMAFRKQWNVDWRHLRRQVKERNPEDLQSFDNAGRKSIEQLEKRYDSNDCEAQDLHKRWCDNNCPAIWGALLARDPVLNNEIHQYVRTLKDLSSKKETDSGKSRSPSEHKGHDPKRPHQHAPLA